MRRTLANNTTEQISKKVLLQGWVNTKRDHGKITFIDLRDRSGIVQVVGGKELVKLRPEDVVEITGTVKKRPRKLINPNLETGKVEVEVQKVTILNKSKELPFPIDTTGYQIGEELRLKYRYLDLRRPRLQRNIKIRSAYVQAAREYLFTNDFVEIETPILTKSTPEGARDFVVPSRLNPGKFFALPQSPQQYKQLLMTAGFERYFQIARCLRDEDLRADRGFEHTQIDIEMSFVSRKDVRQTVEEMTIYSVEKIGAKIAKKPFPVVTYKEAIKKYGADRFDLRTEKEKKEGLLSFAWVIDFPFFEKDGEGKWTFTHNPFSQPIPEHEKWLIKKKNIDKITTSQYDLVCNGLEVAGGSIRSNKTEVLKSVFQILGYGERELEKKFGHMLEAFEYGTPPHGGCAQGFERLLMAYLGEEYLREVQAFPQTGSGRTSVMDAPSEAESEQLKELHIKVIKEKK
jgi:aspartyl-tRNA synthetase